jgi:predicted PurR-regulated permease PerM
MEGPETASSKSRIAFLLLLAVGVTLLLFAVVREFVVALIMAAVLAAIARPVHDRVGSALGGRRMLAAALTVALTFGLVILPILLVTGVLLQDASRIGSEWRPWLEGQLAESGDLQRAIDESPVLQELLPYQDRIVEKVGQLAGTAALSVARAVVGTALGTAQFVLMLFVTLYAMFTFLVHGRSIVDAAFHHVPLSTADREHLVKTFASVSRATLKGKLVIGIVQGGLAGAAFAVAGIEGAVFWGAVMAVLSIIPGIGSALVWVPAAIYLFLVGRVEAAVALALWCGLVVGTVDNVLQPMLVGEDTNMPDLMVLLTTLGGLALFGVPGVLLGPLVGAMFFTIWKLWDDAVLGHAGARS